jgi:hypothetical protein
LRPKARQQGLSRGFAACFGGAARPDLGNLLAMGCDHKAPAFFANFAQQAGKGTVCLGG